jgi:predicted RecB family nuclease
MSGTVKYCSQGHEFYKSSDCPTCPVCEEERKPKDSFLALIAAPARRALEREKINTLDDLAAWTEKELVGLHGVGPSTLPVLRKALEVKGLSFRN